ncbi:hypothetical protein V1264_001540 [Littorina saxatilis]|uniref:Uncharacterized protein n=1 Tax=Littorina saxatilis TaxID=31220 RepID=A0AAN9C7C4_9CAEN
MMNFVFQDLLRQAVVNDALGNGDSDSAAAAAAAAAAVGAGGKNSTGPAGHPAPDSEPESDNFSETEEEVNLAKLDDADREMYEKFKQQEREEREEIERELKAHQELVRHQEELRLREKELQQTQDLIQQKRGQQNSPGSNSSHGSRPSSSGEGVGDGGRDGGGGGSGDRRSSGGSGGSNHHSNNNSLNSSVAGGLGGLGSGRMSSEELRAHVQQAAQLAALGQFSAMSPHLGMPPHGLPPRDLNGLHPLRAAGMLPTHGPFATGGGGGGGGTPVPDKFPRPPSQSAHPPSSLRSSPEPGGEGRAHHWTFEEQFKQLYELSDDNQRKEFLDDLFAFMQKRGSPVNRIPIMAKQTLDLYELFRLVVSKGGLVEVINKKLWREITKGLNLPSSITSAAFTLRTQYMKYLYPYECEKLKLSNPSELQAAIDGNRREGRRSSYGYDLSPGPTLVPSTHHLNGSLMNGKLGRGSPGGDQWTNGLCATDFWGRPQGIESWRAASPVLDLSNKTSISAAAAWAAQNRVPPHVLPAALDTHHSQIDDDDSPPHTPHPNPRGLTERDALAMEAASRAMEEATRKMEARLPVPPAMDSGGSPPRKRQMTEDDRMIPHVSMPSAHLKITSRNDGRSEVDGSLVVTMEVNGIMYQGLLFATAHPARRM